MDMIRKFQDLLRRLFQFEASDLDFGIYRILNYKRDKVEKFIQQDLKNRVETAFAKHKDEKLTDINRRFEEAKEKVVQVLGREAFTPTGELKEEFKDTPLGRDFLSLKAQKDEAQTIDEIKLQVFNDLYNFFSRFYEEGDFIPHYRYSIKGHKYAIPYNGEEVKLYWANSEQYYTKTGLLFRDYTFRLNSPLIEGWQAKPDGVFKVIFRIVSAKEELASNKATKERFFVLDDDSPLIEGWQAKPDGVFNSPSQKGWQAKPDGVVSWKDLPYNPELKEKARELRKAGNLAEVLFWQKVKNKQFLGLDFDRQKVIGNYIVDFFCKNLPFVVEIDGESHDLKGEYDEERDRYLKSLGLTVFHFLDKDIKQNLDGVLEQLRQEIMNTPSLRDTPLEEGNTPRPSDTPLEEGNTLIIRFQYRELTEKEVKHYEVEGGSNPAKQEKINKKSYDEVLKKAKDATLKAILSKEYKNEKALLLYHISRFTAKNTKDYFIHKNLKKFLSEQLDYFIKAEVLDIETLENERFLDKHITRAKVVREIGEDIISFLSQIEDFQKRLWEKKKFVLKTEYVTTTDRVPEEFYEEIWKNEEQRKEWKDLGFEIPEAKEDLGRRTLPIDTKHFSPEFKERLLEKLTNTSPLLEGCPEGTGCLDNLLDGLLIKSENWQALNLLLGKYKEKVQTIYIDPPFNKEQDADYLYNVKYKDSTWVSLLENRLWLARNLLSDRGSIFVRCDYNGNWLVRPLMNEVFGEGNFRNEIGVRRFRKNVMEKEIKKLPEGIDTIFIYSTTDKFKYTYPYKAKAQKREGFWRHMGDSSGQGTPKIFFGKYLSPPKGKHWKYSQEKIDQMIAGGILILVCSNCGYQHDKTKGNWKGCPICKAGNPIPKYWVEAQEEEVLDSNWTDLYGYSTGWDFPTENSEILLKRVIESTSNEGDLVLDFFLGSGTTTAVAHKLKRKWIGIEMGEHFWTVVLPRMKKVLYYDKSGISKEKDVKEKYNEKQAGGFFKYQILEQYEDTLDNIELKENQKALELFKDEYLLKYFLDYETRESLYLLNIDSLKNPFAYKLKVNLEEVGEPQEVVVDIPETFNYLLGLKVKKIKGGWNTLSAKADTPLKEGNRRKYLFILGEKQGKNIAIVWREYDDNWGEDDFKKDKEFIIKELKLWAPHIVYVNGQSILTPKLGEQTAEIRYIEPEFKKLMEE